MRRRHRTGIQKEGKTSSQAGNSDMYVLALPCLTMLHEEKMTWQGTSICTLLSNLDSSQPYGYNPVDPTREVWSLDVQHEMCVCGS
jgi:hypothetical protein